MKKSDYCYLVQTTLLDGLDVAGINVKMFNHLPDTNDINNIVIDLIHKDIDLIVKNFDDIPENYSSQSEVYLKVLDVIGEHTTNKMFEGGSVYEENKKC